MPMFTRKDGCSGGNYRCEHCGSRWVDHIAPNCQCPKSQEIMDKPAFYAKVRAKLGIPNVAVRINGETVEIFGFPRLTEVSNRTYPFWYFAGKVSNF